MVTIFGKKKNIHPEILLDSQKVDTQELSEERQDKAHQDPQEIAQEKQEIAPRTKLKVISSTITPRSSITKRTSSLEKCRQNFYTEKLQIEKLKLEELKKRNALIAERNEILRDFKCKCQCNLNSIL